MLRAWPQEVVRMARNLLSRLRSHAGETIAETLVSILISALALTILATVIGTAVNIVTRSRDYMRDFYQSESDMVRMTTALASEQLDFGIPLKVDETITVTPYSAGNDSDIVLYERSTP